MEQPPLAQRAAVPYMPVTRVEVTPRQGEGMRDVREDVVRRQLKADHGVDVVMYVRFAAT